MADQLAWGILGAGRIARTFAQSLAHSRTGRLVAIGSRSQETADQFGREFGLDRRHPTYEALLADPEVEAVYIATPHPMHAEWAIKAAEAGKHLLCEKPLTLNHPEAMAVVEAARARDVFLMEAFMYRCHPQTARLVELIREGAIGEVRAVQATFAFNAGFDPAGRLFAQALGGGGILDIGCYCTSMARLVAGAATGTDFAEPSEVKATGHLGETGVDEWTAAALKFPGGMVAQLLAAVRLGAESVVRIFGADGWIFIPQPWIPGRDGQATSIFLHRRGQTEPEEIVITPDRPLYALEADTVAAHLQQHQAPPPAMTWADTLGNMKTLDRWRESIGLVYDLERPEAQTLPVSKRPLAVRADQRMTLGEVAGVGPRVARLVMGVDNQRDLPHAAVMFDDYFERGGNCFDTAYIYAGGQCERVLGHWVANRGVRDRVVIITKGVHSPFNFPQFLRGQLLESLERLQTDYVDLYFAHRDNPEVPIGEWVDAFNDEVKAGRIHAFGGSNWALERIEAGNEYARAKGLAGFSAVSNNFSLARMVDPVWAGCISASDPQSRAWLERTRMPLFAWSSQARRFFAGAARPDDRSDEEMARCWYSPDNFQRLERANQLAAERGVPTICIALAYVLAQPFPTFALIGPRTLEETRLSFQALEVELTPGELRWLNLEE